MHAPRSPMHRWRIALAIALPLLLGAGSVAGDAAAGEIVAIVNEANSATDMSLHRLRLLYALYQRSWHGGIRVKIVLPPPDTSAMHFLVAEVFRKGVDWEIDRFYIQAVFQQKIPSRPDQLPSALAITLVRSSPGAIAIVDREDVTDPVGLRILTIRDGE